jgi:sigma-B regulation protein RsbU (phosphoserine phosphatase)
MADNPSPSAAVRAYQRQLDLIAEMSQEFAASRDIGETLQRGLQRVAAFVGAEAASLFLIDETGGEMVCRACFGPVEVRGMRLPAGYGIVGRTIRENHAIIVKDARQDPDFGALIAEKTGYTVQSILCAPLSVGDIRLGAIELINKAGGGLFQHGDRQMLQALGASAALAIVNARLTGALVEQERMRRELELAAEIQRGMLPTDLPEDFPIQGVNVPAHAVSGDFFDILRLPGGAVAFAIGDVAGKGINAALLMTRTSSLFRCLAKTHRRPAHLLAAINAELCEAGLTGGMFVTMAAGLFDPRTGSVLLANAGHEPSLLRGPDGGYRAFPAGAPPLGIGPELVPEDLPESWIALAGGSLYLFTDGLTETRCHDLMMIGDHGMRRLIDEDQHLPATRRLRSIIARLAPGETPPRDDLTLMVVEDQRPPPLLVMRIEACPECLGGMRHRVSDATLAAGCAEGAAADVVLAVDEACQNIIRHGYRGSGPVELELFREGSTLVVQLIDFAPPADPDKIKPRPLEELRPGGLGTHFMRCVMDDVAWLPPPFGAGNLLRMSKVLPCP